MGKVTINDVAALAGVSKKTVSHVVNGIGRVAPATRARVEAAVAELGFVPSPQARAFAELAGRIATWLDNQSGQGVRDGACD